MVAILPANLDFLDERLLKKRQVLIFYRLKTKNSLVRPRVKNFKKKKPLRYLHKITITSSIYFLKMFAFLMEA